MGSCHSVEMPLPNAKEKSNTCWKQGCCKGKIKVVIVGDGAVGKSCLMDTMTGGCVVNWDDPEYQPTSANNTGVDWDSDTNSFEIELWDTAGQEALSHLRAPAYLDTHVFVLAYDMTQPHTLENVLEWYAEIRETCADYCGAIMVGTKYDLWREMLMDGKREQLVDIRRVG